MTRLKSQLCELCTCSRSAAIGIHLGLPLHATMALTPFHHYCYTPTRAPHTRAPCPQVETRPQTPATSAHLVPGAPGATASPASPAALVTQALRVPQPTSSATQSMHVQQGLC
jgi:hypothetical protein